jgi:hypothetical protein
MQGSNPQMGLSSRASHGQEALRPSGSLAGTQTPRDTPRYLDEYLDSQ